MKIKESAVQLEATHALDQRSHAEATSSFRTILQDIEAAPALPPASAAASPEDQRTAEERMRLMLQQLVAAIIEAISGQKCRCGVDEIAALPPERALPTAARVRRFEWQRTLTEHVEEHERTAVSARGSVHTADGRAVDFDLSLAMCRDFVQTRESVEHGALEFKDPLVVNFDGCAAELTDARFDFDLDADGQAESLPVLAGGSGYLVLDADRDGRIADGREVVGALSGDAFGDLGKLDSDGNGWVDEADPAYAALGVWFPDGKIAPLKETGVGALHTGSSWSPFALRDADNGELGHIWRSGVYLHEDGRAGSLQQVDLGTLPSGSAGPG